MAMASHRTKPLGSFQGKPTPRLYDRLIGVLRVRHSSRRTEEAYVHWIGRYIEFHRHQHPRELAESDVNRFLTHLAVKEHVAASTHNQALSAILFLYEHVLEQPLNRIEGVHRARRPKRLPVVLARNYPNANRQWCWQFASPQGRRWRNCKTGEQGRHHVDESLVQRAVATAVRKAETAYHAENDRRKALTPSENATYANNQAAR